MYMSTSEWWDSRVESRVASRSSARLLSAASLLKSFIFSRDKMPICFWRWSRSPAIIRPLAVSSEDATLLFGTQKERLPPEECRRRILSSLPSTNRYNPSIIESLLVIMQVSNFFSWNGVSALPVCDEYFASWMLWQQLYFTFSTSSIIKYSTRKSNDTSLFNSRPHWIYILTDIV